jgi:hypothetical protein
VAGLFTLDNDDLGRLDANALGGFGTGFIVGATTSAGSATGLQGFHRLGKWHDDKHRQPDRPTRRNRVSDWQHDKHRHRTRHPISHRAGVRCHDIDRHNVRRY